MRGSLGDNNAPDGVVASYAGLTGSAVHAVTALEAALLIRGIDIIGNAAAAGGYGFSKHLLNRPV